MQPSVPNPYDDTSPYGEALPFVEYTPPKEAPSVPTSVEVPPASTLPAAPPLPVSQPETPSTSGRRSPLIASLLVVLVFVIIAGSGITWYATGPYSATLHAQATAVVQNIVQSQKQAAQATASALANSPASLYTSITKSPPDIVDPLNNPNDSIWSGDSSSSNNSCSFSTQAFHVKVAASSYSYICFSGSSYFNNFAFQVQTTLLSGAANGIALRVQITSLASSGYYFYINPSGEYFFNVIKTGGTVTQLTAGITSSARTGLNQTNLLTVIALGSTFYLYINGQFLNKVNDTTFDRGIFGLVAFTDPGTKSTAEAVFSNAQIWMR